MLPKVSPLAALLDICTAEDETLMWKEQVWRVLQWGTSEIQRAQKLFDSYSKNLHLVNESREQLQRASAVHQGPRLFYSHGLVQQHQQQSFQNSAIPSASRMLPCDAVMTSPLQCGTNSLDGKATMMHQLLMPPVDASQDSLAVDSEALELFYSHHSDIQDANNNKSNISGNRCRLSPLSQAFSGRRVLDCRQVRKREERIVVRCMRVYVCINNSQLLRC